MLKIMLYADCGKLTYPDTTIQKGWQCPICQSVMAPTMMWCIRCSQTNNTVTTNGTTIESK